MPFLGIIAFLNPSFCASLSLRSACEMFLISPESATPPQIIEEVGSGKFTILEKSEAATARSADGSYIFSPPTMFRYTSFLCKGTSQRAFNTAMIMANRLISHPTTALLGFSIFVHAINA